MHEHAHKHANTYTETLKDIVFSITGDANLMPSSLASSPQLSEDQALRNSTGQVTLPSKVQLIHNHAQGQSKQVSGGGRANLQQDDQDIEVYFRYPLLQLRFVCAFPDQVEYMYSES